MRFIALAIVLLSAPSATQGRSFTTSAEAQTLRAVTMPEAVFRRIATTTVAPSYPTSSMARGAEGVVVVRVRAGLDNRVERVDVLQSPDADIAESVRSALMQWTVARTSETGGPVRNAAESKVTFYFQIRNGKGVVLNPNEMPGNEQVFAPPARPAAPAGGAPMTVDMREGAGIEEIDEETLWQRLSNAATVLLDLRDRGPFAGSARPRAINIPVEELTVRAGAELSRDAQIVIDCSQDETFRCRVGHHMLVGTGFKNVSIYLP